MAVGPGAVAVGEFLVLLLFYISPEAKCKYQFLLFLSWKFSFPEKLKPGTFCSKVTLALRFTLLCFL